MESKTLHTIQVFMKIGRVLSKIAFVASIVGASLSLIALISVAAGDMQLFSIGGVKIHGLIPKGFEFSPGTAYAYTSATFILLLGEVFIAGIAARYFKNELAAGTPFTLEGSKEMLHTGVCVLVISLVSIVLVEISYILINNAFQNVADLHVDSFMQGGVGLGFIITSFLCRYGAEISAQGE